MNLICFKPLFIFSSNRLIFIDLFRQALTTNDDLNSKPSDPLVITWPGVQVPVLRKQPSISGNCIRITWLQPDVTEGVKIKQYKV